MCVGFVTILLFPTATIQCCRCFPSRSTTFIRSIRPQKECPYSSAQYCPQPQQQREGLLFFQSPRRQGREENDVGGGVDDDKTERDSSTDDTSNNKLSSSMDPKSSKVTPQMSSLLLLDPTMVKADLLAVLIACQLLGLLDVLASDAFASSGGWLQPIPMIPSTLPILAQRCATNALVYCGGVVVVAATTAMVATSGGDNTLKSSESIPSSLPTTRKWVVSTLQLVGAFSMLRLLVGFAVKFAWIATSSHTDGSLMLFVEQQPQNLLLWEILRECYVVTLMIVAGRYLCHKLFYEE